MGSSQKVAITIPDWLFEKIERTRRKNRETRSSLIQRAIQTFFSQENLRSEVQRYIEGYRQCPESDEEVACAEALAKAHLARVPWE